MTDHEAGTTPPDPLPDQPGQPKAPSAEARRLDAIGASPRLVTLSRRLEALLRSLPWRPFHYYLPADRLGTLWLGMVHLHKSGRLAEAIAMRPDVQELEELLGAEIVRLEQLLLKAGRWEAVKLARSAAYVERAHGWVGESLAKLDAAGAEPDPEQEGELVRSAIGA